MLSALIHKFCFISACSRHVTSCDSLMTTRGTCTQHRVRIRAGYVHLGPGTCRVHALRTGYVQDTCTQHWVRTLSTGNANSDLDLHARHSHTQCFIERGGGGGPGISTPQLESLTRILAIPLKLICTWSFNGNPCPIGFYRPVQSMLTLLGSKLLIDRSSCL